MSTLPTFHLRPYVMYLNVVTSVFASLSLCSAPLFSLVSTSLRTTQAAPHMARAHVRVIEPVRYSLIQISRFLWNYLSRTYGASDVGYRYADGIFPTPLLTAVAIAIATARLAFGRGIVLDTQLSMTWKAENAPIAQRKKAKYRAPITVVEVAVICPTIPMAHATAICHPLSSVFPECQLFNIEKMKAAKYGGAVSSNVVTRG